MRSIWSGSISFGLVNIPVTLYPATQSKSLSFRLLNKKDHHPVKYLKVDDIENTPLSKDEIVKGYEFEKDRFVVLEDEDFKAAEIKTGRAIEISDFVSIKQIDPVYYKKSYYLFPQESSKKAYKVFESSLKKTKKGAIGRVVIRNKQELVVIRPKKSFLIMETMFYQDEIRKPTREKIKLDKIKVSESEKKMAEDLIDAMSGNFEPKKYSDNYRQNLLNIIQEKIKGHKISMPEMPEKAEVVDIMGALRKSIEKIEKEKKLKKKAA